MDFEDRYSWSDRLLHRVAFQGGIAQRTLADVEEALYGDEIEAVSVDEPVFISSLPRAGTTILLRLLWNTDRFATHTYEDMPFVLCPMIWRQFSRRFESEETVRERAHGDGIEISERSPEAFEEMIWKHFWPDQYTSDRIHPWTDSDRNRAFDAFFETHMQKVIAIRGNGRTEDDDAPPLRYVSKNNLNISRLASRPAGLRKGTIVIPFRDPVQQAASMLRQHERFLEIHAEDAFVREYMEAIGHHEFGEGLKPVNFNDWLADDPGDPTHLAFWLRYWVAAYRFVLDHKSTSDVLVSYANLTETPNAALPALADAIGLSPDPLSTQAEALRPPRTHPADTDAVPSSVLDAAAALHERLRNAATV